MTLNTIFLQAEAAGGMNLQFIIMMVLIFVVMYFLMIRPQQKRQKELNKFRNSLQKGSKIITAGGIYGTVKEVQEAETVVTVEISPNVNIRIDKAMIMRDPSDVAATQTK